MKRPAATFRRIALSLPEVEEQSHMKHPDFRVRGKIFATLGYPDRNHGMVKLPPDIQRDFVRQHPEAFVPVKGSWGAKGATSVRLAAADAETLGQALTLAWQNVARRP